MSDAAVKDVSVPITMVRISVKEIAFEMKRMLLCNAMKKTRSRCRITFP